MAKLTEQQREFLANPFVATVTTLRDDGSPHNTVVWMDTDGETVRFNTAEGRAKLTTEGADEHIDKLAKKYLDKDVYPWHNPDEPRVSVTIEPEQIDATGLDG